VMMTDPTVQRLRFTLTIRCSVDFWPLERGGVSVSRILFPEYYNILPSIY
jgi:hypothetical protein